MNLFLPTELFQSEPLILMDFVFLIPAVIYGVACMIVSSRLNTILGRGIISNY